MPSCIGWADSRLPSTRDNASMHLLQPQGTRTKHFARRECGQPEAGNKLGTVHPGTYTTRIS